MGSWKWFEYQDRAFRLECLTKSLPEGIIREKETYNKKRERNKFSINIPPSLFLFSSHPPPHKVSFCTVLTYVLLAWERCFRYGFLLLESVASQDPLSVSVAILHQFNILPEMYQVGYTKLFFRTGQVKRYLHEFLYK